MYQPFYATQRAPKGYTTLMKVGRFTASLMRAPRLVGDGIHGLPPGEPVPCYPVDSLLGCPQDWVGGEGSYVCPVDANWGLWFAFNSNDHLNTAVLTSVKGMNPITGQKMSALKLEKYGKKCPVHDVDFQGSDRFCEKCGYKWPAQSYVAPPNISWLDGFREAKDGTVRQFFFTEDEERDVASAVIGEKNTVPAFGFAFFEPKIRRESPPTPEYRISGLGQYGAIGASGASGAVGPVGPVGSMGPVGFSPDDDLQKFYEQSKQQAYKKLKTQEFLLGDYEVTNDASPYLTFTGQNPNENKQFITNQVLNNTISSADSLPESVLRSYERDPRSTAKVVSRRGATPDVKVSVGAGARIRQDIVIDPLNVSDWKDEPSGIIRLYFVFESKFEQILSKGFKDIEGTTEGYLKGVTVG